MTLYADPKMFYQVERTLREWQYKDEDGTLWRYAIRYSANPREMAEYVDGKMTLVEIPEITFR